MRTHTRQLTLARLRALALALVPDTEFNIHQNH